MKINDDNRLNLNVFHTAKDHNENSFVDIYFSL